MTGRGRPCFTPGSAKGQRPSERALKTPMHDRYVFLAQTLQYDWRMA